MHDLSKMQRRFRFLAVGLALTMLSPSPSWTASLRELQFLEDPYTHAILHTAPSPDPEVERNSRRNECSPREDLTRLGLLLARNIGTAIQKAGTRVDHVLASPRCNAVVTARKLELVPVDVEAFLDASPPKGWSAEDQRDEALVFLAGLRPLETALLVTHGQNIAMLTGVETVPGQMLIVSVSPLGELEVRFNVEP